MICMNLKDDEHADAAFMRAWNIALTEHYIHPFIEHHGLLQGQIERSLREQYPDEYNEIHRICIYIQQRMDENPPIQYLHFRLQMHLHHMSFPSPCLPQRAFK